MSLPSAPIFGPGITFLSVSPVDSLQIESDVIPPSVFQVLDGVQGLPEKGEVPVPVENFGRGDFSAGSPVAAEKLENFYALTRTPVTLGEQVDEPCTLPAGAIVPERRNIFPNTSLEIAIPSRVSVIGFLVGWACVAAIVICVYKIANG